MYYSNINLYKQKAIRIAFSIYDSDEDRLLSEKDLFNPFLSFSNELYSEVFLQDLSKLLKQINVKKSLNKQIVYENEKAKLITDKEALTLKEFSKIYEQNYPAIIDDLLSYMILYNPPKAELTILAKPAAIDNEEDDKSDVWKDKELKNDILSKFGNNKERGDKVLSIFRSMCINPRRGETKLYLTLASLTKNFVFKNL